MSLTATLPSLTSPEILKRLPTLEPEVLAYEELKRDPHFSYLPKERIPKLIASLLQLGRETAKQQPAFRELAPLINHLLQQGVRVRFASAHPEDVSVRAQYQHHKPPQITIFRRSLSEIRDFFQPFIGMIPDEELIRLHLYHEWFHHLEESQIGRADLRFAHLSRRYWGPKGWFSQKKPLLSTREIAAHAFTQQMMALNWFPLLLDQWIVHHKKGDSTAQMREAFWRRRQEYQTLLTEFEEGDDEPS